MELIMKIKNLDSKFSWSFLGFVIGIIGIGISIYAIFFHHPAPDLTYRVLTNTNVVI